MRKHTSPDLLDLDQVADYLNVSNWSVRRLDKEGRLVALGVTPGRRARRMVRRTDLQAFLTTCTETTPAAPPGQPIISMTAAGWSGKDHLTYDRKPRKDS